MECLDNTEIAVHDASNRIVSLIYYQGGGYNNIYMGRDMGWGTIGNIILNGKVGIGTTPTNNYALAVNGDVSVFGTNGVTLPTTETRIINNQPTLSIVYGGDFIVNGYWGVAVNINTVGIGDSVSAIQTKINNTASFTVNSRSSTSSTGFDKTLFTIRNSGNVGIGTTNPQQLLDINGSLVIRAFGTGNSGTAGIFLRDQYTSVSNNYNCSILTYDHNADNASDGISINAYDGVSICTGANTRQERMRITVSGNVGIGTTTTVSNSLLQLHSTTQTQPRLILSGKNFYNGLDNSSHGIAFLLGINSDNSNRQLWIADSSLLAINTTNPIFRINLINNYVGLDSVATNGTTQLPITFGNTNAQTILAGSTIYLNGNVGIGTSTSITSPLTVNGNIYSSGDIQGATATVNGVLKIAADNWITSSDNMLRIHFANNSDTLFQCSANYSFRKTSGGSSLFYIAQTGNIGIGTTTNLTSYLLNVNGAIGTLNNSIYIGTGTYYGGSLNLTNTNNGYSTSQNPNPFQSSTYPLPFTSPDDAINRLEKSFLVSFNKHFIPFRIPVWKFND
jgi:hypothetical protein